MFDYLFARYVYCLFPSPNLPAGVDARHVYRRVEPDRRRHVGVQRPGRDAEGKNDVVECPGRAGKMSYSSHLQLAK